MNPNARSAIPDLKTWLIKEYLMRSISKIVEKLAIDSLCEKLAYLTLWNDFERGSQRLSLLSVWSCFQIWMCCIYMQHTQVNGVSKWKTHLLGATAAAGINYVSTQVVQKFAALAVMQVNISKASGWIKLSLNNALPKCTCWCAQIENFSIFCCRALTR